jgi:L-alanine-DL-glutamate epimerase-like enolase superfamily enzyme
MKIESIEVRQYRIPLEPPFRASWDPRPRDSFSSTIVVVRAGGHEGVASGDAMLGLAGNEGLFVGGDVFDIERHVAVLENLSFHYGRMWPLEIALWDLAGKIRGERLWRMLSSVPGSDSEPGQRFGGAKAPLVQPPHVDGRVRVYASTGERVSADERAASAVRIRDAGFPAIKMRFHADDPAEDIAVVRAVRDAVGPSMEIMVDANQGWRMPWDTSPSWDYETALGVADQLSGLGVYWLEEPMHRHDHRGLAKLRTWSTVKIAGGEGNREFAEFDDYLAHGSLDVYQPDVAWTSGVLRATQLARKVAAAGAMYTPHTWGDGLVLLANLHVAAACSNAPFVEYAYDPPNWTPERRDFMLPSPIVAEDGWVTLPDAPGLGVEIDWNRLEEHRVG